MVECVGRGCDVRPGVMPPSSERGTILVLTSVLLFALLAFAAIAVDLGNAWSNSRRTQSAADVAAVGALQQIPYTLHGAAVSAANAEASALVTANDATVDGISVDVFVDSFDGSGELVAARVMVDSSVVSTNAFAGIFGSDQIVTHATATGIIVAHEPSIPLMPLGFNATAEPLRCLGGSGGGPIPAPTCPPPVVQPGGTDIQMIGMRRRDVGPCTDAQDTMTANFANGVDHLVDVISTGVRDEKDHCDEGHVTSLPTTSQAIPSNRGDVGAIISGGLSGRMSSATPLWSYLLPGLPAPCDDSGFGSLPTLEDRTQKMRACLASGNAQFSSLAGSGRFAWGVDTAPGGSDVVYEGFVPIWLHTVLDATGAESLTPPPNASGLTVFLLGNATLADTLEYDPGGLDNLDFMLED